MWAKQQKALKQKIAAAKQKKAEALRAAETAKKIEEEKAKLRKTKYIDLSNKNGKLGVMADPLFIKSRLEREIFVNYDTDNNNQTDWQDTLDPKIEYVEADGVLMFHLDFEQNPEEHCNDDWPADIKGG